MARGAGQGKSRADAFTKHKTPWGTTYWTRADKPGVGYLDDPDKAGLQPGTKDYPLSYINYLLSPSAQKPSKATKKTKVGQQVREMTASGLTGRIPVVYGRARVGGSLIAFRSVNSIVYESFSLCHGPIQGIVGIRMLDQDASLSGGAPFGGSALFQTELGLANPAGAPPSYYLGATDNQGVERFPYLATAHCRFIVNPALATPIAIPDAPTPLFTLDGRTLRDPRLGVDVNGIPDEPEAFSKNPALALADYYTSVIYGPGYADDRIYWDSVGDVADYCDVLVASLPRHTINWAIMRESSHREIIDHIKQYGRIKVFRRDGKLVFAARKITARSTVFTPDNSRPGEVEKVNLTTAPNVIKGTFTNPSKDYGDDTVTTQTADAGTASEPLYPQEFDYEGLDNASETKRATVFQLGELRNPLRWTIHATSPLAAQYEPMDRVGYFSPTAALGVSAADPEDGWVEKTQAQADGTTVLHCVLYDESYLSDATQVTESAPIVTTPFLTDTPPDPTSPALATTLTMGDGFTQVLPWQVSVSVNWSHPGWPHKVRWRVTKQAASGPETVVVETDNAPPVVIDLDIYRVWTIRVYAFIVSTGAISGALTGTVDPVNDFTFSIPDAPTSPAAASTLTIGDGFTQVLPSSVRIEWAQPSFPGPLRWRITTQPAGGTETVVLETDTSAPVVIGLDLTQVWTIRVSAFVLATQMFSVALAGTVEPAVDFIFPAPEWVVPSEDGRLITFDAITNKPVLRFLPPQTRTRVLYGAASWTESGVALWDPTRINDGGIVVSGGTFSNGDWVRIDFGSAKAPREIRTTAVADADRLSWTVEVSDDDSAFTPVAVDAARGQGTYGSATVTVQAIDVGTHRYARLTAVVSGPAIDVREIQFYEYAGLYPYPDHYIVHDIGNGSYEKLIGTFDADTDFDATPLDLTPYAIVDGSAKTYLVGVRVRTVDVSGDPSEPLDDFRRWVHGTGGATASALATMSGAEDTSNKAFDSSNTAVTQSPGDNSTKLATTEYVDTFGATLGTMATQDANAVAITGGSITGITDLAVADGGTGSSNASDARTALGVAIGTNVQAYSATLDTVVSAGLTAGTGAIVRSSDVAELAQDAIGAAWVGTSTIDVVYGDIGNQFSADVKPSSIQTSHLGVDITAAGKALLDDANAAAQRTTLGLVIGTDVQAQDAELSAIAGLTSAADKLPYFTGAGTAGLSDFTAAGRAILDDADATAQRATLGLVIGTDVPPVAAPQLSNVNITDSALSFDGAKWQMFGLQIANNGGTLQHRMFGSSAGTNASAYVDKIAGASATYANTPTLSSIVDFVSGGGVISEIFHFNTAAQLAAKYAVRVVVEFNNTATPGLQAVGALTTANVNGVSHARLTVSLFTAAGVAHNINITNIGSGTIIRLRIDALLV